MNSIKRYFLKLTAESVKRIDECCDGHGFSSVREAMKRRRLCLDPTGQWWNPLMSSELQNIISKHREYFFETLSFVSECPEFNVK